MLFKTEFLYYNTLMEFRILSPAGSPDAFKRAVTFGAQSVYLGLDRFNARMKAPNFTLENLEENVRYAHLFDCKVFLTVNISLKESELPDALDLVIQAYQKGIDGVILADLGLLRLLKQAVPELYLVASTQLNVHNRLGAEFCKTLGFRRIVLARETHFNDIAELSQTGMELEGFAQGAMCVSQSGQCLFSSLIASNSGNRGLCAQPCRKKYVCYDKNGKQLKSGYLMSMKDLCCLRELDRMKEAGITSFKIEGRNRRAEYVAQTTKLYVDALRGDVADSAENELKKIYNRGDFTKGYLFTASAADLIDVRHQGHKGKFVGKFRKKGEKLQYRFLDYQPTEDSGFKIFRNGEEVGSALWKNDALKWKGKIKDGDEIYVTTDRCQIETLNAEERKLPVSVKVDFLPQQPLRMTIASDKGIRTYTSTICPQQALTAPLEAAELKKQFSKVGEFPFQIQSLDVRSENAFCAKSQINEFRRDCFRKYYEELTKPAEAKVDVIPRKSALWHNSDLPKIAVLSDLPNVCEENANLLWIYKPADYEKISPFQGYLAIPSFSHEEDEKVLRKVIETYAPKGLYVENLFGVQLAKEYSLPVLLGLGMNVYNTKFVREVQAATFTDVSFVCSGELNGADARDLLREGGYYFAEGNLDLMKWNHCPVQLNTGCTCADCKENGPLMYRDEKGYSFTVLRTKIKNCYFMLRNERPLIAQKIPNNCNIFLNLENYDAHSIRKILQKYENFIETGVLSEENSTAATTGHSVKSVK